MRVPELAPKWELRKATASVKIKHIGIDAMSEKQHYLKRKSTSTRRFVLIYKAVGFAYVKTDVSQCII